MRVAIVNDMLLAAEALRRVIIHCPDYEVAWIAVNGREALEKCRQDRPDMILMDLIMPEMDGVEATRRIMKECPCPILVVTATVDGHISRVFEAMGHGALDAVNTPVLGMQGEITGAHALIEKMNIIARLNAPLVYKNAPLPSSSREASAKPPDASGVSLVVLGASTGGPNALARILAPLSADIPAAFVIVQHVDQLFAGDLAAWLSTQTALPVNVISPGVRPERGKVLLAGTNDHLVMQAEGILEYRKEPEESYYRPSVDVFFHSLVDHWRESGTAILLTGMGRDGGEGLLALRRAGWYTITQDEASSVVYGMPKYARELGAAVDELPLNNITNAIQNQVWLKGGYDSAYRT